MTPSAETAAPGATRRIACPRCTAPMRLLSLSSHKGQPITVEHCPGCRLVWFDEFESVQLDGFGWVRLLREMEHGARRPLNEAEVSRPACPVCAAPLNAVQNRSRFGLFAALECPRRHGHLHSHSGLLAERGLVRPLGVAERRALAQERHTLHCLNCGGAAAAGDDDCSYCGTPLVVLDLPRLAHSLRLRLDGLGPSPQAIGRHTAWPCRGCGAAIDPGRETACAQCGHVVVAQGLPDIEPLLAAAEADLSAAAAAEAERLARYPSTRRRPVAPAPAAAPVSAGAQRWRGLMLGGWSPLLLGLAAAFTVIVMAWAGWQPPWRPPLQALRSQHLVDNAGSPWIWLRAYQRLQPGDAAGLRTLRRGLLDLHTRQLAGQRLPLATTVGDLIDGAPLPSPAGLAFDPVQRWQLQLAAWLRVAPSGAEPSADEVADIGGRLSPAAPGVWIEIERRGTGLWLMALENTGPVPLLARQLSVRITPGGRDSVNWRCRPAQGADAVLRPGARLALSCRTTVAPGQQPAVWQAAMAQLQSGEPPTLDWRDEALSTQKGFDAATDLLAADAAPAGRRPSLSWRERWQRLAGAQQRDVGLAVLAAAFGLFCVLARWFGERRAVRIAVPLALLASVLAGRGEGAASVLLVGMYLGLSTLALFAFVFGFRLYRQAVFRRFGA